MTPEVQALIDQTARHHAAETARISREGDAEIMRRASALAAKVQQQCETIAELLAALKEIRTEANVFGGGFAEWIDEQASAAIAKAEAQQ